MKKDKSEYVKAKVNQYGIKILPDGQKYLLCHFVALDDGSGKTMREELDYIMGKMGDREICISAIVQDDNGQYLFEPFQNRATGFIIEDYKGLIGWSCQNESTNRKRRNYGNLQAKTEYEFIQTLKKKINTKKEQILKDKINQEDFLKFINNFKGKTLQDIIMLLGNTRGDIIIGEGKNSVVIKSKEKQKYMYTTEEIARNNGVMDYMQEIDVKKMYDGFLKICNQREKMDIDNNQMNIISSNISSMIINISDTYEDKNIATQRLTEIVMQINDIIDIQLNTFGHKNIPVRDAKTKQIKVVPLNKFVELIEEKCKKNNIKPFEINKKFPTSLSVLRKMEELIIKKEENKVKDYIKTNTQKNLYEKKHTKSLNHKITIKANNKYLSK